MPKKHCGPSKASLREMPEVDFTKVIVKRNLYARRIVEEGMFVKVGRRRVIRILLELFLFGK